MAGLGRGLDALLSGSRAKQERNREELKQQETESAAEEALPEQPADESLAAEIPDDGGMAAEGASPEELGADLAQPGDEEVIEEVVEEVIDDGQGAAAEPAADMAAPAAVDASAIGSSVVELGIDALTTSTYQPRKSFDEESLNELAESIREHGLLEPLLVKKNEDKYEIICGERRFRAAKIAGLATIPCLVRDVLAQDAYAIALIENIQREDLNPLEYANALMQMQKECEMTQEDLAKTLGKSRTSITNYLRLNNLDESVKKALSENLIDMGHAKVILGLDPELQATACEVVVKKELSVRQTEIYVRSLKSGDGEEGSAPKIEQPVLFKEYEKSLSDLLDGAKVKFVLSNENKGKVTLSYSSQQQLDKIIQVLGLESTQA